MNKKVHKDFHGAFSYMLIYLEKNYGKKALKDYLLQVAKNVYGGLSEKIKRQELNALEKHLKKIFEIEDAKYKIIREDGKLILDVKCCPALKHMRKRGYPVMKKFCECDRVITGAICRNAGIKCNIKHDQRKGKCIQEFFK
jgi:hypothetical protein